MHPTIKTKLRSFVVAKRSLPLILSYSTHNNETIVHSKEIKINGNYGLRCFHWFNKNEEQAHMCWFHRWKKELKPKTKRNIRTLIKN